MTRPTAFVCALADLQYAKDDHTFRAHVALPFHEIADFTTSVGRPADAPAVALLACRTARHPQTEADALAEACVATLTGLFETGQLGSHVRPLLHEQMAGLFNAAELAWQLPPARAEPEAEEA